MKKTTSLTIIALLIMSFGLSTVQILLNLPEDQISTSTQTVWSAIFFFLTIFWAYYDADNEGFKKPFDFGLFIYVFWYVAFPWYLIKTRGVEGILLYFGFVAIWLAPWVSGLVAYAYYS